MCTFLGLTRLDGNAFVLRIREHSLGTTRKQLSNLPLLSINFVEVSVPPHMLAAEHYFNHTNLAQSASSVFSLPKCTVVAYLVPGITHCHMSYCYQRRTTVSGKLQAEAEGQ